MRIPLLVSILTCVASLASGAILIDMNAQADEAAKRVMIGVNIGEVGEALAAQIGVDPAHSILVASVVPGMPAEKAGLARFDVITAVDGEAVDAAHGLRHALDGKKPGESIELTVLRNGKKQTFAVAVVEQATMNLRRTLEEVAGAHEGDDQHKRMLGELLMKERFDDAAAWRGKHALEEAERARMAGDDKRGREMLTLEKLLAGKQDEMRALESYRAATEQQTAEARALIERALADKMTGFEAAKEEIAIAQKRAVEEVHKHMVEMHERLKLDEHQKKEVEKAAQAAEEAVKQSLDHVKRRMQFPKVDFTQVDESGKLRMLIERERAAAEAAHAGAAEAAHAAAEAAHAAATHGVRSGSLPGIERRLTEIERRLARIEELLQEQRKSRRAD